MSVSELLAEVQQPGGSLHLDGDGFEYRGPAGSLTPELRAQLVDHKPEILEHLQQTAGEQQSTPVDVDELERAIRYAGSLEDLQVLLPRIPEEHVERLVAVAVRTARQLEEGFVNRPSEKFTGAARAAQ